MLAFLGVWVALAAFLLAAVMVVHRPTFTDLTVLLVLYFGAPGAMCLAGLTLWAHRKDGDNDPGVRARRLQSKVAIALAILAAAIVYGLVMGAEQIERRPASASNDLTHRPASQ
ncbi:MAG: hypothetical protein HY763_02540 [Planctomycetes bacterium]|nr:hypothetical protein [Planctomycetota bacterium]